MRRLIVIGLILGAVLFGLGALERLRAPDAPRPPAHASARPLPPLPDEFAVAMDDLLPRHKAVRRAQARFDGRVLAIDLVPARPAERAQGTNLIYRLRLLTPARAVLDIRMDAVSGRFVEVAGTDLTAARQKPKPSRRKDD
ncbi:PepSY domain-containing protein [Paracoccus sanguinis]|uniref:PepSY domain-containing protein n=1 Tax=Paracoccus sanguinis TaxID=1545044 RepID=UPI0014520559|nr:hypothetical protein [Paracoccus sanguinis]QJD15635.1 hypothetical protein HGN31_00995 [Paracoccus sanguinis]